MNLKILYDVETPMRDGVVLRGNLYRPDDDRAYPAVLLRTPYVKDNQERGWGQLSPLRIAKAGYNVFQQDTRGTGRSEGQFTFFFDQGDDGYDTVEWLAAQPWCDGNVGAYGHSYYAYTQLALAAKQPPHLRCICPFMQSCLPKYSGGFLPNALHAQWLSTQASRYLDLMPDSPLKAEAAAALRENLAHMREQYEFAPEIDMPIMQLYNYFPFLKEYRIKVDGFDRLGAPGVEGRPIDTNRFQIPALMYAGLYDTSSKNGPFENFERLSTENPSETVRRGTRLVVGPWKHSTVFAAQEGELSFPGADGNAIDVQGHLIRFFDRWLKGAENGQDESAPVRLYVMGANRWRDENEWPIARTVYTDFYLRGEGHANTAAGDGRLSLEAPAAEEPADSFTYDPLHPAPSSPPNACSGCINDYRSIETREDILVYSYDVTEKDGIEASGHVDVELEIESSAPDTDFFCRLLDVHPNGKAINITEGGVRARYNNSYEAKLLTPGEVRRLTCHMGNTSICFKPGHQIRLEVTSSCFPFYDRNHNTGNRPGVDADFAVAVNTVRHDAAHPSRLVLPVIPAK